MTRTFLSKWFRKFRDVPSLAAIANKEEGQMLIRAAMDDSIKQVTVQGSTYTLLSAVKPDSAYAYDSTDEEIDTIFNFVDWMLLNKHFMACNNMLAALPVYQLSTPIIIAFLTITAAAKSYLYYREDFFLLSKKIITSREGIPKMERLLE